MSELFEKIPNNVNLSHDKKLQRALESWQPSFLDWWHEMGPNGYQKDLIYLRTAVSVEPGGWAHFDYVKMPDYRWGIFLAPPSERTIGFGDNLGQSVWQNVPGEFRKELRRIIVTQADTEPASVEQQCLLGNTAPSLYDLRNLFQVNVEEGRHLWAMVYLLHSYFGRDGREEAEELLERRSGHKDSPRILETFNEPITTWLDFFCFTMFTDRDGKYQLASLAESSFDPLARTTQFMLTEEAHHLFVGETGIGRIVKRSTELMKLDPNEDVKNQGGIPLDMIQSYINYWYSLSLDLFGGEDSSNAATYFGLGLKGRYKETSGRYTEHLALDEFYISDTIDPQGQVKKMEIPMRRAMNMVLRDAYIEDCERALKKWNFIIKKSGINYLLSLPSLRFNRHMGIYHNHLFSPLGEPITQDVWEKNVNNWLPNDQDRIYVESIMKPVYSPGQFAHWIAPPKIGTNRQVLDFEYIKFCDQAK